jgi:hypothetical protein
VNANGRHFVVTTMLLKKSGGGMKIRYILCSEVDGQK